MSWIIADAHVHVREFSAFSRLLQAAADNFNRYEQRHQLDHAERFLFLTEKAGEDVFAQLRQRVAAGDQPFSNLRIQSCGESNVVQVTGAGNQPILVVAGRQIVTGEGIELLAIGRSEPYADGASLSETYETLAAENVLLVLPWGVGKWLGRRGKIIADFIDDRAVDQPFLGDNGNRPFLWPLPSLFRQPLVRKERQLPGSDSLPLVGEEQRAGGYGFYCRGTIDPQQPFSSLVTLLRNPQTHLHPYGSKEGLFRFLKHQVLMRKGNRSA